MKTRELLEEMIGGVLFIDEAYDIASPNNENMRGSDYGYKSLTEIVNFMTQKEGAVVFIMAGYPESLEKNLFKLQKGLGRRFRIKINIGDYKSDELADIFLGMISNSGLKIDPKVDLYKFFNQNLNSFLEFGGDCRTLSAICRELVADDEIKRVISLVSSSEDNNEEEYFVTFDILNLALQIKEKNKKIVQLDDETPYFQMYN